MKFKNENMWFNKYINISKWCCLLGKISQKKKEQKKKKKKH